MSQTEAGLSLREPGGLVRVGVSWPASPPERDVPAMVLLADGDASAFRRRLAVDASLIVLSVETEELDVALTALEWTADHVEQLGGDPSRLAIGGLGRGSELAAAAALHARHRLWPVLARQVLIAPRAGLTSGESLVGVAPATLLGAPGYAARLRDAGVEVEELGQLCELPHALARAMSFECTPGLCR